MKHDRPLHLSSNTCLGLLEMTVTIHALDQWLEILFVMLETLSFVNKWKMGWYIFTPLLLKQRTFYCKPHQLILTALYSAALSSSRTLQNADCMSWESNHQPHDCAVPWFNLISLCSPSSFFFCRPTQNLVPPSAYPQEIDCCGFLTNTVGSLPHNISHLVVNWHYTNTSDLLGCKTYCKFIFKYLKLLFSIESV